MFFLFLGYVFSFHINIKSYYIKTLTAAWADFFFLHSSQIPKKYRFVDILMILSSGSRRSLGSCISKFTKGIILIIPLSVGTEHLFVDLLLCKGQASAILSVFKRI